MSHRTSVRFAALAVASTLTGSVLAQTNYVGGNGVWNNVASWDNGVPTNAVQAVLPAGGAGTITLGADVAGYLTVNDNYTLTGGTLTVGSAAALSNTNGAVYVADGSVLTLANNSLFAGTSDTNLRLSTPFLTGSPATASGNGIVRLGSSQNGLASVGRLALGAGAGGGSAGVIVEIDAPAALGNGLPILDVSALGGGSFQFGGRDQSFNTGFPLDFRNDINLIRYTGTPGAITIANKIEGDSPFKPLFFQNTGSTVTVSGELIRRDGNNRRAGAIGSWGGTTLQIGVPNPGVGNADYLLDNNSTVGLTGNKRANGTSLYAVNGKIEVYKANQDTTPFATGFGGAIDRADLDLYMGLVTGVRGQDTADVNAVSQVEFYNQAQGGAIADGSGISQYRYGSLVNESARYQLSRGQPMIPLEVITNANTNVTFITVGAGICIDARGDIIKKGPGTLTFSVGTSGGGFARGGVVSPGGAPFPVNYEGFFDVQAGGLIFKSVGTTANNARPVDDMFDGATGSTDEAGNGIINYRFANGTTLGGTFTDVGTVGRYNFKSDVTLGVAAGDVVTFDITTGGAVAGKGVGFGSGITAKPNPALNWNGTLKKTGTGLLAFGGGAARIYNVGAGAALQVDAGRAQFEVTLNAPTLPVTNNGSVVVTASGQLSVASLVGTGSVTVDSGGSLTLVGNAAHAQATLANNGTVNLNAGNASFGTISGTGSTNVGGGASLKLQGSGNTQGTLGLAANSTLAVDIAALATFDSIAVSGSASVNGNLAVALVGSYEPAHADTFAIITSGGMTGTFSNTNAWGLIPAGTGKAMLPEYTATDVVLKEFTKVGDVDFDGLINNQDIAPFVAVLTGVAPLPPSSLGFAADVNGDGLVNNQDIAPFVALLTGGPSPVSDADLAPLMSLVPEPASLSLLALGGLALRRRRHA